MDADPLPVLSNDVLRDLRRHCDSVPRGNWPSDTLILRAADEIERLLRGDFTEPEFQNLCWRFSDEDEERFRLGCEEDQRIQYEKCQAYRKKLFGKRPT